MDFSQILRQEIEKKKKVIEKSRNNGKKEYVKTADLLDQEYDETLKLKKLKQQQRLETLKRKREKYVNHDASKDYSDSEEGAEEELNIVDANEFEVFKKQKQEEVAYSQDEPKSPNHSVGKPDDDITKRMNCVENKSDNKVDTEVVVDSEQTQDEKFGNMKDDLLKNDPTESILLIPESMTINKDDIRDNLEKVIFQVRNFIIHLLSLWTKRSKDADLILETKRWMVPLLVQLKSNKLPESQAITLSTIFYNIQQADYLQASESYMKLSIGNVAWPIGVINVGIHSRSAHSRLTGSGEEVSNIMKDEKTRRWVLAVKRLITFVESQ